MLSPGHTALYGRITSITRPKSLEIWLDVVSSGKDALRTCYGRAMDELWTRSDVERNLDVDGRGNKF